MTNTKIKEFQGLRKLFFKGGIQINDKKDEVTLTTEDFNNLRDDVFLGLDLEEEKGYLRGEVNSQNIQLLAIREAKALVDFEKGTNLEGRGQALLETFIEGSVHKDYEKDLRKFWMIWTVMSEKVKKVKGFEMEGTNVSG